MLGFNIGIDLLHITRIRALLSRQGNKPIRFAAKILTAHEHSIFTEKFSLQPQSSSQLQQKSLDAISQYLAVRWAAKEAAYKASSFSFTTTNQRQNNGEEEVKLLPPSPTWKDFEVLYKSNGRPYLSVLKDEKVVGEGKLSISHDGDFVVVVAVLPE